MPAGNIPETLRGYIDEVYIGLPSLTNLVFGTLTESRSKLGYRELKAFLLANMLPNKPIYRSAV